jgi:DNA-binding ferritin-like protein
MKTRSHCKKGGSKTSKTSKTRKTSSSSYKNVKNSHKYSEQLIVTTFLQMLNTIKLYHWKTTSYSQHKATDELYTNLNTNIDSFVEVMLGKTGSRVNLTGQKTLPLLDYTNLEDFKKEIEKYKVFLINMKKDDGINITKNSDLLNIRDELLANLNQFTYLLTFK